MTGSVLPLQTILFQVLFLLMAIALEARVLRRRLRISRKTSMEYATSINLLSAVVGWLSFFIILSQDNWLPRPIKDQIISFIFFDRLVSPVPQDLYFILIGTGIVIFIFAFLIKLKGLQLLEALLEASPKSKLPPLLDNKPNMALRSRLEQAFIRTDPNEATTVLLANAYSHSAILLLLFLRFIQINPIS